MDQQGGSDAWRDLGGTVFSYVRPDSRIPKTIRCA